MRSERYGWSQTLPKWRRGPGAGLLGVLAVGVLSTALLGADCTPDDVEEPPPPPAAAGPALDPSATLITIDAAFNVDPAIVEAKKSESTKLQWVNNSNETVILTFDGAPGGMTLPAGAYSYVWQVNPDASESLKGYSLSVPTSGDLPPGSPAVDVGP